MSKSAILIALNTGEMRLEALRLSAAERTALADYLGTDAVATASTTGVCARDLDPPAHPPIWNGWGGNLRNTRFQSARSAALTVDQVKTLKLKWAFGFPGASATYGQPTSYAGKLLVGSEDGTVYALDAATGCSWWTFKATETVKTAISIGDEGQAAFFGDTTGNVYAVKVEDGSLIWKVHPEQHPAARITGSPLVVGSRLFVPVSSGEEGAAADPKYPCCTFRGSVVALDAKSGKRLWQAYTIPQTPRPTQKSKDGIQFWGPSGAAVWSSPTADLKRHLIYVTTGNNYSGPSTPTSDAVIALDMNSGAVVWSRQMTPRDLWNSGCVAEHKENCPEKKGDDFDFGAPPLLRSTRRGDVLLLAQKSGIVYALDPDRDGQTLWQTRIGRGGPLGGIQWGGAADSKYGYFPLSDWQYDDAQAGGGLFALDVATGKRIWFAAPVKPACAGQFGCSAAQMAPPTLIPGVVLSGSMDGHLRAYDTKDGSIFWDFDATHEFQTVNGVKAHGGSFNGAGATVVGGMVFVNAGYNNAIDGNVLLAFSPE
ncbi:MAG TPA: PQQ-binding-like beta-propeller repeat protein [Terriglobales bacterium]|nr:PQQ-binding-like beta-propeller repeat protein [Terriglobales bacterium]